MPNVVTTMHIANKMAIETVATVVKGAGQHSGPQGTIVEAEEKVRSLKWLLELKYYKRLTSTHFLFTCCSEAAVKQEMSQYLSFTMVPCGPECCQLPSQLWRQSQMPPYWQCA